MLFRCHVMGRMLSAYLLIAGAEVIAEDYVANSAPVTVKLQLKKGDHWGAEHCFKLKAKSRVQYQFNAQVNLSFDFHLHPHLEDGAYRTEHYERKKGVRSFTGQASAENSGLCCFHFYPDGTLTADREISLHYQVDNE